MKTFSFAIAVVIALAFILIQDSYAELAEEVDVAEGRRDADFEPLVMPADELKEAHYTKQKRESNPRGCRYCCNCCSKGPAWCGICCDW